MDTAILNLTVGALRAVAFLYDFLTLPVYYLIQKPWKVMALAARPKAKIIAQDSESITWRSLDKPGKTHIELIRKNVDTMACMLEYLAKKFGNRNCLGTRVLLGEDDEVQPDGKVFKKYDLGDYAWISYADVNRLAINFGKGIIELGNKPKENIVIFAETRAEWAIAAHGLFKQSIPAKNPLVRRQNVLNIEKINSIPDVEEGACSLTINGHQGFEWKNIPVLLSAEILFVTIYVTLGDDAIAYGINETEVTTVITSYDLMPKFKNILAMTPKVNTLIYMEDQLKQLDTSGYDLNRVKIIKYSDVMKLGEKSTKSNTMPSPDDIAIIMYTSGSTGVPKGVILDHLNIVSSVKAFFDTMFIGENERFLCLLPLAHVFELLIESVGMCGGASIGYSSALTLLDSSSKLKKGCRGDATLLKPTCMGGVPLILDRISKGIEEKVSKSSLLSRIVFNFAFEYKRYWVRKGYTTPFIDRLVFRKIGNLTGGHVGHIFCGGAPLSAYTQEQIQLCLCVRIIQGYGLTESTACATVPDAYEKKFGVVGHVTTSCDLKLLNWEDGNYRVTDKPYPRGEIVLGGNNISRGYYKLPEKTTEDFYSADGKRWFRTGDIAEIHEDGVVNIVDRRKDLVKLQAGEYVSLGKVEAELKTCPLIDNICVYGNSNKQYCVSLIIPNPGGLEQLASKNGITGKSFEELCDMKEMEKLVVKAIMVHGKLRKLEKFEIPTAVTLCKEIWSPDMGLVTAAFKLKRKEIQLHYQKEIDKMYKM